MRIRGISRLHGGKLLKLRHCSGGGLLSYKRGYVSSVGINRQVCAKNNVSRHFDNTQL
jgi:hypothetical protein